MPVRSTAVKPLSSFRFVQHLLQDKRSEDSSCWSTDHIAVYDGPSADTSPLIGVSCGSAAPYEIQYSSSEPVVTVVFHSDAEVTAPGFILQVSFQCPDACDV
eukprot:TRINITY_DN67504_c11_g1_i3.p4 TRINITY_DN67504_c11_g1~~TRINITY_DN67504_c11_g1_i3.p4  ORF type:complete len:102 (-),score=14.75 TRINITY_DN67504_c11_g1_i3:681-986(-)